MAVVFCWPNLDLPLNFLIMKFLDVKIDLATRHVQEGRCFIEQQRKPVAEKRGGRDGLLLLVTYERVQKILESDLDRLLAERDKLQRLAKVGTARPPKWTKEDDQRLLKLKAAGKRAIVIAKELRRTESAIVARMVHLKKNLRLGSSF